MSSSGDRFYLAKHEEVSRLQLIVNQGRVTKSGEGCDNIPLKIIDSEIEEGNWGLL